MNSALATHQPAAERATTVRARSRARQTSRVQARRTSETIALRSADARDATAIHALIAAHLAEGHLLPRTVSELALHAPRFVVAVRESARRGQSRIVGCAELAPLSGRVAEVRSLVVDRSARSLGIGRQLVDELRRKATIEGFERLCAFTHDAGYFVRKGFSIVPHQFLPEKIARDCHSCALFRRCGQYAVVLPLAATRRPSAGDVPLAALRG